MSIAVATMDKGQHAVQFLSAVSVDVARSVSHCRRMAVNLHLILIQLDLFLRMAQLDQQQVQPFRSKSSENHWLLHLAVVIDSFYLLVQILSKVASQHHSFQCHLMYVDCDLLAADQMVDFELVLVAVVAHSLSS